MFDRIKFTIANWFLGTETQYITQRIPQLTGKKFNLDDSLNISTVYTCIRILSDTISRMPAEIYQSDAGKGRVKDKTNLLYPRIHFNFNDYTTSNSGFNYLETVRNLKGNSFLKINRGDGKFFLTILPTWQVKGYGIINNQLYYFIKETEEGETEVINSSEVCHFKMMTRDGILGVNPLEALRANLSATDKGISAIDSFYDNNANSSKALKSTVSGANTKDMLIALEKFKTEFAGAANAGKMIPLPPNTEIQELKLNFADAEFINTVRFNSEQIAAVYGVPPDRAGILTASKFNSVEFMGLSFKVNTISSIAQMYKQELSFKLLTEKERLAGKSIEFNTNALIELDSKAKTEMYKTLSLIGAISPNQISQFENLPTDPAGDVRLVPMNIMNLKKISDEKSGNETE